jgi:hypothetical protein
VNVALVLPLRLNIFRQAAASSSLKSDCASGLFGFNGVSKFGPFPRVIGAKPKDFYRADPVPVFGAMYPCVRRRFSALDVGGYPVSAGALRLGASAGDRF